MVFVFCVVGFDVVDIYMIDIINGCFLVDFVGFVVCGGFFFGDVFGVGQGWVKFIFFYEKFCKEFVEFFQCKDIFVFGVCNGCQMFFCLKEFILGVEDFFVFVQNNFIQFEVCYSMVKIEDNLFNFFVFFNGMNGFFLFIVVFYGEGCVEFQSQQQFQSLIELGGIFIRYIDNRFEVIEIYFYNFNGSFGGIVGVVSRDGRVLVMMFYFERIIMVDVMSYVFREDVEQWGEFGFWLRMFRSVRCWVGQIVLFEVGLIEMK